MLLSVSAAVESIAVNSDLENIKRRVYKHHEPELTGSSKIRQVPLLWVDVIYLLGCCHRNKFAVQLWFALIAFNESNCAQK